jgi:hypothetical protein
MSHQSPGISLCQRGGQFPGDSRPLVRFSLRPASGSEGVQCVGNENSYAQNNEKCGNNLEHRRTLRNRCTTKRSTFCTVKEIPLRGMKLPCA